MGGTRGIEAMDPLDLREWEGAGIHAKVARRWIGAGFELEKAVELTAAGFEPEEPKEWTDSGFTLDETVKLKASGLEAQDAKEWKERGFTPHEASDLIEAGLEDSHEALIWSMSELNLADARDIKSSIKRNHSGDKEIDNGSDVLDSRDVLARILRLAEERVLAGYGGEELDEDLADELEKLQELEKDARAMSDWQYGATLVRDSYFLDYAQETAEHNMADEGPPAWPNNHIDWEAASEELKMHYSEVSFSGVTYWARK